jgi:SOS response regulatory protein OraA/RecX
MSIHQWRANLRGERIRRLLERGYNFQTIARMLDIADEEDAHGADG